MLLSHIWRHNLPQEHLEKSAGIGILFREELIFFPCVFPQVLKGIESFDLSLVDQIHKIDVRCVDGLWGITFESLLDR